MLSFITSLSFLYLLAVVLLVIYGILYYREFARSALIKKRFPWLFALLSVACMSFLWIHFHAPSALGTYTNLDHYFLQQDGYRINRSIELGYGDTSLDRDNATSKFVVQPGNDGALVSSSYSEEPFYTGKDGVYQLISAQFPTQSGSLQFNAGGMQVDIGAEKDGYFNLQVDTMKISVQRPVRRGITAWTLFGEEPAFITSTAYANNALIAALRGVYLVRSKVGKDSGSLVFYLSSRLVRQVTGVAVGSKLIQPNDLGFSGTVPSGNTIAWGLGFFSNNRDQYIVKADRDVVSLLNKYPVSYPLSREAGVSAATPAVHKFLVADAADLAQMAPVFREGFLFSPEDHNAQHAFDPVLLNYQQAPGDTPVDIHCSVLSGDTVNWNYQAGNLVLPARNGAFNWLFSIRDTFSWQLGGWKLSPVIWQGFIFGSLLFFILCVLVVAIRRPPHRLSWVWQLFACITVVLLTTRFFLYWRYKSFPPFDSLDFPSLQQLNSLSNFFIIVACSLLLGVVFVVAGLYTGKFPGGIERSRNMATGFSKGLPAHQLLTSGKFSAKTWLFLGWFSILLCVFLFAAVSHFDSGVCRHLAIGLIVAYFLFLFISYRYSPLVKDTTQSWWRLNTLSTGSLLISNPVKILLSVPLLAVLAMIDIGFSIVFLNFLLFNEGFLCSNYAIAGLSAGSKRNARLFMVMGFAYLTLFVGSLLYAPYVFSFLLRRPGIFFPLGYGLVALLTAVAITRVFAAQARRRWMISLALAAGMFTAVFLLLPRHWLMNKVAVTRYRVDVQVMPPEEVMEKAYTEGDGYGPVIRAAQNQWFINTLTYDGNNPAVDHAGFHMLPHAPQNKGARYNAQATDLVASRFLLAEHGKAAVILYVLLLLLPVVLLASFYKLYPDLTNRTNQHYPAITTGFSIMNYLFVSALLVILAATGKYIFFGQDLPFGSILSKQSMLVPSVIILLTVFLFTKIPQEYYANRRKLIPGLITFVGFALLLVFVQPSFNKNRQFNVDGIANGLDEYVQRELQPIWDYFDSAHLYRKKSVATRDRLFCDSVRARLSAGDINGTALQLAETKNYINSPYAVHLHEQRLMFLDLHSGIPQLAVNANYFRVDAPPHLRQSWTGSVYGDSARYNLAIWDDATQQLASYRLDANMPDGQWEHDGLYFHANGKTGRLLLINRSSTAVEGYCDGQKLQLAVGDSLVMRNPMRATITVGGRAQELVVEPDAIMKNYYVNGARFYAYPMGSRLIWARNFSESIAADQEKGKNVFLSLDRQLMDSLYSRIAVAIEGDTAYSHLSEYGVTVADGNGRLLSIIDFIKDAARPDPNDKNGFLKATRGEEGYVPQSVLRRRIGNINLLRLNPGPGSTLKPIIFTSVASQMNFDWDQLAVEGFSGKQHFYGGEKVAEYDFEKNNGRISSVVDYLRYSDNYYHSNVLLLGSYPKQDVNQLLASNFKNHNPDAGVHWPWFTYRGRSYFLDGYSNWPGYSNGRADFGSPNSFVSIGLWNNYGIYTKDTTSQYAPFATPFDSALFGTSGRRSGFILPEYALFDQRSPGMDHRIPYDIFATGFRGHVKGSSQVAIPPVKMLEAFGRLASENNGYALTLNPYAGSPAYHAFDVTPELGYPAYLSLVRERVFAGLKETVKHGTAARLGALLPSSGYFYYAKTGTTGDDQSRAKSKLFAIIISKKDISDPAFNFRDNRFYVIYFTSQNGAARQNEELQADIIKYIESTAAFKKYMQEN